MELFGHFIVHGSSKMIQRAEWLVVPILQHGSGGKIHWMPTSAYEWNNKQKDNLK